MTWNFQDPVNKSHRVERIVDISRKNDTDYTVARQLTMLMNLRRVVFQIQSFRKLGFEKLLYALDLFLFEELFLLRLLHTVDYSLCSQLMITSVLPYTFIYIYPLHDINGVWHFMGVFTSIHDM